MTQFDANGRPIPDWMNPNYSSPNPQMPYNQPNPINGINGMNGMQGFQPNNQQQRPSPFSGHFVNDHADIMPNEVPMDGRLGIFPLTDLTGIYVKAWNAYGNMTTVRYVPDPTWQAPATSTQSNADILKRLEAVERSISEPQQTQPQQRSTNQAPNQQRNNRRDNNGNA